MTKNLSFFMMAGIIFIFQGCVMAGGLISDIKDLREKDRSTRLDVSTVVRKHIQIGSTWELVLKNLSKDGFECRPRPLNQSEPNLTIYDCILDLRHWYQLGFGDKLILDILVKNNKIVAAGGELFYMSL